MWRFEAASHWCNRLEIKVSANPRHPLQRVAHCRVSRACGRPRTKYSVFMPVGGARKPAFPYRYFIVLSIYWLYVCPRPASGTRIRRFRSAGTKNVPFINIAASAIHWNQQRFQLARLQSGSLLVRGMIYTARRDKKQRGHYISLLCVTRLRNRPKKFANAWLLRNQAK